jgi:hypothetical protein
MCEIDSLLILRIAVPEFKSISRLYLRLNRRNLRTPKPPVFRIDGS